MWRSVFLLTVLTFSQNSLSTPIYADSVIDHFDSGSGSMSGPYGGQLSTGEYPKPVTFSYVTDESNDTFISLPTDSYITLTFSGGSIVDGPGDDLIISESGGGIEKASVFISDDWGDTFYYLGVAIGADTKETFDLASIGYDKEVNTVKIVGLDSLGSAKGFDLAFVAGLNNTVIADINGPSSYIFYFGVLLLICRRVFLG